MSRKGEWGRRRVDNQAYPKTRGKEALPTGLKQVTPVRLKVGRYGNRSMRGCAVRGKGVPRRAVSKEDFPYDELEVGIQGLARAFHDANIETMGACGGHDVGDLGWDSAFITFIGPRGVAEKILKIVDIVNEENFDEDYIVFKINNPEFPDHMFYSVVVFMDDGRNRAIDPPENAREINDIALEELERAIRLAT